MACAMMDFDVANGSKSLSSYLNEIAIRRQTAVAHLHIADGIVGRTVLETYCIVLTIDVAVLHKRVAAFKVDSVAAFLQRTAYLHLADDRAVAPVKVQSPAPSVSQGHVLHAHVPAVPEPDAPGLLPDIQRT